MELDTLLPQRRERGAGGMAAGVGGGAGQQGGGDADEGQVTLSRSETVKQMIVNGYQVFRILRLRTVHAVCCQLAGLREAAEASAPAQQAQQQPAQSAGAGADGEQPGRQQRQARAAELAEGKVFVVTALPGAEAGARSRFDVQQVDLTQDSSIARWVTGWREAGRQAGEGRGGLAEKARSWVGSISSSQTSLLVSSHLYQSIYQSHVVTCFLPISGL